MLFLICTKRAVLHGLWAEFSIAGREPGRDLIFIIVKTLHYSCINTNELMYHNGPQDYCGSHNVELAKKPLFFIKTIIRLNVSYMNW